MLVITRKIGERFTIGDDVEIEVTRINHGEHPRVRLAIRAPRHVKIMRSELLSNDTPNETTDDTPDTKGDPSE